MGQGDLLELCVAILCMGEAKLQQGFETLMASFASPRVITSMSRYLEVLEGENSGQILDAEHSKKTRRELVELRALVKEERVKHREVLRLWIQ